jgi:hypothetical protein
MLPLALRVFARTAFVLSTAAIFSTSCSRQGEGDRCDLEWGGANQDCQADLICTACGNLQDATVDRCCRRDGGVTDARCAKAAVPNDQTCSAHKSILVPGAAGTGTAGSGTAGSGTAASGGSAGSDMSDGAATGGLSGQGGNAGE